MGVVRLRLKKQKGRIPLLEGGFFIYSCLFICDLSYFRGLILIGKII